MIKLLNKFYKWRGTGDKLDNIPIFIFFGLVLGSIIPIDALFFMSIFSARAFFPLYYYYDNMFLSVLFFPFFAYFHFTLLSLIIHKFDLSWLKNKGWKRYIDFIFFIWFGLILGAIINKFFPDMPGFDLFDIILISLLILWFFYRVLNSKRLQKIYFDGLKKMKEDGKNIFGAKVTSKQSKKNLEVMKWILIILMVGLAASKIVEFNKEKEEKRELVSQEDKDFSMNYLLNNKIKDITKFSDNLDDTNKYCKILTEYEILNNHIVIVAGHLYEEKIKLDETTRSNWNHATDIWKNASKKLNKLGEKIRSEKNINIGEICK